MVKCQTTVPSPFNTELTGQIQLNEVYTTTPLQRAMTQMLLYC